MTVHAFRFHSRAFHSRFRSAFEPRKPRHWLARVLLGVLGLALLAVLVVAGAAVGGTMLLAGLLLRRVGALRKPVAHPGQVVEGEYRVLDARQLPR